MRNVQYGVSGALQSTLCIGVLVSNNDDDLDKNLVLYLILFKALRGGVVAQDSKIIF